MTVARFRVLHLKASAQLRANWPMSLGERAVMSVTGMVSVASSLRS